MKKTLIALAFAALGGSAQANNSDYAHFSFVIDQEIDTIQTQAQQYETASNEYWMSVSGKQLAQGIPLATTQAGVTILVSAAHEHSQALDTGLINLESTSHNQSVLSQKVSASELSATGVFDKTLALVTDAQAPAGELILSSKQTLSPEDRYIVTVKEKNSPLQLKMNIDKQSFTGGQPIQATATMASGSGQVNLGQVEAQMIAPDGSSTPVLASANGTGTVSLHLVQPEKILSPRHGLYELKLSTSAEHKGLTVKRNGKLAVALVNPTANIQKVTLHQGKQLEARVQYAVSQSSRFEVRATLFGTDVNGKLVPVMESHAAHTSAAGEDTLKVPFDLDRLEDRSVSAPWVVQDVRLYDQQQLGLLERYNSNVVL